MYGRVANGMILSAGASRAGMGESLRLSDPLDVPILENKRRVAIPKG
jgi:hypothetical protein